MSTVPKDISFDDICVPGPRIYAHSAKPEFETEVDKVQRYWIPCRMLPVMRKGIDRIILPAHASTRQLVDAMSAVLQFDISPQVFWTSDTHFVLDKDIEIELLESLVKFIQSTTQCITIVPYSACEFFYAWFDKLVAKFDNNPQHLKIVGDSFDFLCHWGNKGIIHRKISEPGIPAPIEAKKTVRAPRGYLCTSSVELVKAYRTLCDEMGKKDAKFLIKPVLGSQGEGITYVESIADVEAYKFPAEEDILLEECLELDMSKDGKGCLSPVTHFVGRTLCGPVLDQIMMGCSYSGWRPTEVQQDVVEEILTMTNDLLDLIQPEGPGGFDFLLVRGIPYLVDVNCGRFNGSHPFRLFAAEHGLDVNSAICWKILPADRVQMTALEAWNLFKRNGIAIDFKTKCGVLPITWISSEYILLAAFERNFESVSELKRKVINLLIPESDGPQRESRATTTDNKNISNPNRGAIENNELFVPSAQCEVFAA